MPLLVVFGDRKTSSIACRFCNFGLTGQLSTIIAILRNFLCMFLSDLISHIYDIVNIFPIIHAFLLLWYSVASDFTPLTCQ